jgi:hypothetical protein
MKKLLFALSIIFSGFLSAQTPQRSTFYPVPNNTYDLGLNPSGYWDSSFVRYGMFVNVHASGTVSSPTITALIDTNAVDRTAINLGIDSTRSHNSRINSLSEAVKTFVPYTGATTDLNLGVHGLTAASITDGYITIGSAQINRPGADINLQFSGWGGLQLFGYTRGLGFIDDGNATYSTYGNSGTKVYMGMVTGASWGGISGATTNSYFVRLDAGNFYISNAITPILTVERTTGNITGTGTLTLPNSRIITGGASGFEFNSPISSYNGVTTEGLGVPIIVDSVERTTTASIGTTNFNSSNTGGYYEVSGYLVVTSGTALGAITITIGATDALGAYTITPVLSFAATGTGRTYFSPVPVRTASGYITYATTVVGSPTHKICLVCRRLY